MIMIMIILILRYPNLLPVYVNNIFRKDLGYSFCQCGMLSDEYAHKMRLFSFKKKYGVK